jgi:hypothetical protein
MKSLSEMIVLIFLLIKITYQVDIIGFYQKYTNPSTYEWLRCDSNCYTCNKAAVSTNQNCLSCNAKEGKYLLDGDNEQNCYTRVGLPAGKEYILDTKHIPIKWVACHENCLTCSDKVSLDDDQTTIIQMNCIKCKSGYIKVNTFCYQIDSSVAPKIGFSVPNSAGISTTKYCGDYTDDETGQQLGIFESGTECIIKPETYYFPNNDKSELLKSCDTFDPNNPNCLECDLDSTNIFVCIKLINLFILH